jgi:hypothetical protein
LREHLPSFECLEILLFLQGRGGEAMSVDGVASRTGTSGELALAALGVLAASGILRQSVSGPLAFRYAPATAWLQSVCDDLARLHREQRAAIMSEMSVNAIGRIRSGSLRAFADAFVLGKNKKDSDA